MAERRGPGRPFSCPECRYETIIPECGVNELRTASFNKRLQTTVTSMERAHGNVETKCELCLDSEDVAVAFCRHCTMYICTDCIKQHKRLKTYTNHELTLLEDQKNGNAKPISVDKVRTPSKCPNHNEPLVIYCFRCTTLICHLCTVKDHKDHNFEFCKKAAAKEKSCLLVEIENLKAVKSTLSDNARSVLSAKQNLEIQESDLTNTVKSSFKELRNILDEHEDELLKEIAEMSKEKLDKLSTQEKNLRLAIARVQSILELAYGCLNYGNDIDFITTNTEIMRLIEQDTKEDSNLLDPVEELELGVQMNCNEALKQLCKTQMSIIELPVDLSQSTLCIDSDASLEVGKVCKATLALRLSSNKISKRKHQVTCSLRSLRSNVTTKCTVDKTSAGGVYSIQFTPTIRGRHEILVSVDRRQEIGHPFPIFVSISPTQLGQPVKVWKNIPRPTGITINSAGDILVAEMSGNIIRLIEDGTSKTLLKQEMVTGLRKIVVDNEDNIYCGSGNYNQILTCNSSGENVKVHTFDHGDRLRGLAMVGDELMMCLTGTKGIVHVYDKQLASERRIQHDGMGRFWCISPDCDGNLYCADYDSSCFQVFSKTGNFLHSFGHEKEGRKLLKSPWGICVYDDHVYVCDDESYSVSVFTTEGVYVTSFGCHGDEEGQFRWPHSICIDADKFVYVTDCSNNRVQCF